MEVARASAELLDHQRIVLRGAGLVVAGIADIGLRRELRGQVALFLGLTMLPFAIVAPLIGPFLDRFSHGRRWAIGATMALRAFLCWALAGAISTGDSPWLFAAALGVLVSSKAYGVTRAAAVPRLLPEGFTLVKANGRVSLSGIVGATVSAPLAGLASLAGSEWSLRYAFVLFVVATVCAIRLPEAVDSSVGEGTLVLTGTDRGARPGARSRTRIPSAVAFALRANCGPRWMSGFLLMFMAFLLRENPPESGLSAEVLIGLVVGAAGLGNGLGVAAASLLRRINPSVTVVLALLADAALALVATLFYGVLPLILLGLVAGLSQSLAAELAGRNVDVTILCPGTIDTAIIRNTRMRGAGAEQRQSRAVEYYARRGVSPDRVAADVLTDISKGRLFCVTPRSEVGVGWLLQRLSPRLMQRIMRARMDKVEATD